MPGYFCPTIEQILDLEQAGTQPVVDVVVVVGDIVAQGRDLRLRPGMAVELEVVILAVFDDGGRQVGERAPLLEERPVVLHRPLQGFPGEVEPVELGVAILELGQDAERLGVVVEAGIRLHHTVQRLLAGMAERRVAEIVSQRHRLAEILVETQHATDGAGDLRHLERMGQPRPIMVALMVDEDLGLVLEAPEGRRMDDAVPVALERAAARRLGLGMQAAAALPGQGRIRRQRLASPYLLAHASRPSLGPRFTRSRAGWLLHGLDFTGSI